MANQRYSGMRAEQKVPVFRKLVATFETRMEPGDASRNCFVLDAVSYSRIILHYLSCSAVTVEVKLKEESTSDFYVGLPPGGKTGSAAMHSRLKI